MSENLAINVNFEKIFRYCDGMIPECQTNWPTFCYKSDGPCKWTNDPSHQIENSDEIQFESFEADHCIFYFETRKDDE